MTPSKRTLGYGLGQLVGGRACPLSRARCARRRDRGRGTSDPGNSHRDRGQGRAGWLETSERLDVAPVGEIACELGSSNARQLEWSKVRSLPTVRSARKSEAATSAFVRRPRPGRRHAALQGDRPCHAGAPGDAAAVSAPSPPSPPRRAPRRRACRLEGLARGPLLARAAARDAWRERRGHDPEPLATSTSLPQKQIASSTSPRQQTTTRDSAPASATAGTRGGFAAPRTSHTAMRDSASINEAELEVCAARGLQLASRTSSAPPHRRNR